MSYWVFHTVYVSYMSVLIGGLCQTEQLEIVTLQIAACILQKTFA